MLREAGPAWFLVVRAWVVHLVPFGMSLRYPKVLVVVSESPDSPVGPAVSGEGIVRVDSYVRLVPST